MPMRILEAVETVNDTRGVAGHGRQGARQAREVLTEVTYCRAV